MDGYLGALGSLPCTISPLNGLANTRDLAWPHRFLAIRRAAPGPKLFWPETKPRIWVSPAYHRPNIENRASTRPR